MAEMLKALLMGVGCLATLYIGSCTLAIGTFTVAASRAAHQAKENSETYEAHKPSKWDKAAATTTTNPSYRST